jgi:Family of unknown function (DUF6326)
MESYNPDKPIADEKDRKMILSTLWIFVLFNFLYADLFTILFNPAGETLTMKMTPVVVLGFAALMEVPIAVILLSRILNYGANRWVNIIAGLWNTVFVAWSILAGITPGLYYTFFATIEIACTVFIVGYAWTWKNKVVSSQ